MEWKISWNFILFFKTLFIWQKERESVRKHKQGEGHREGEKATAHWGGSGTWEPIPGPGILPWAEGRCTTAWAVGALNY